MNALSKRFRVALSLREKSGATLPKYRPYSPGSSVKMRFFTINIMRLSSHAVIQAFIYRICIVETLISLWS